jgi:hypothetical protein
VETQRVLIELHRGDGPITGTFLPEDRPQPMPFFGWIELLALLETARACPETDAAMKEEKR